MLDGHATERPRSAKSFEASFGHFELQLDNLYRLVAVKDFRAAVLRQSMLHQTTHATPGAEQVLGRLLIKNLRMQAHEFQNRYPLHKRRYPRNIILVQPPRDVAPGDIALHPVRTYALQFENPTQWRHRQRKARSWFSIDA